MMRITGLTVAFNLIIGMDGTGTWTRLSDTETSTGDPFTDGFLDLKTYDVYGVSQPLFTTNMVPGRPTQTMYRLPLTSDFGVLNYENHA